MSTSKDIKNSPATLQFFAIFEKGKPIRVLPRVLNRIYMTHTQMANIPLVEALSGNIMIPKDTPPWSEITENADIIFLALQSRTSWGEAIKENTNLLKVETIKELVLAMEESLNNFSFRRDYLLGKFEPKIEVEKENIAKDKLGDKDHPSKDQEGSIPGENWI